MFKNNIRVITFFIFAVAMILLASPAFAKGDINSKNNIIIESLDQVQVGDTIGNLTVENIERAVTVLPLSANNVSITFDGEITITGKYKYEAAQGDEGYFLEFIPNTASTNLLPKLKGGKEITISLGDFYGANDYPLSPVVGKATIVINKYTVGRWKSIDTHQVYPITNAKLIKVIKQQEIK